MDIRYIANACFLITLSTGETILTDPWFTGPCQQTWFNFPPVPEAIKAEVWASKPDLIYISHLHHDHLHAETLAPFDRSIPVLIGKMNTPNLRTAMRNLGFNTLVEQPFETRFPLGSGGADAVLFKDFHGNTKGDDSQIEYDLDTSLYIFDADGTSVFNAVDNTILPPDARAIVETWGKPDVAILPYVSASLFPMAMAGYDDARKTEAMTALRARTRGNFRDVFKAFDPKCVIPAGGEYVLGGAAAGLSKFLPQPLESELAAELEAIGRGGALSKLYPGDTLSTDGFKVTPDARATHRGFTDAERAAYALTLASEPMSFTGAAIPEGLEFDWLRALRKCAANYTARRARMDLNLPVDVYIDSRKPGGEPGVLFRFALDADACGPAQAIGDNGRDWMAYRLDERLLYCLITAMLSWNAMEASALIAVSRDPDIYQHDIHRSVVHFTLMS